MESLYLNHTVAYYIQIKIQTHWPSSSVESYPVAILKIYF